MDTVNKCINEITQVSQSLEEEEKLYESMNAELDKQIEQDMEIINKYIAKNDQSKDSATQEGPKTASEISEVERIEQQIIDDDADMYQSMNAELDKQIAEDMEAIKDYLSKADESVAKRVEFFNKMDKTRVNCRETPITDHILYQHTPMGNIKWHECTQCDYKATEKSKLMEHLMTSHSSLANSDWLNCPRCSFKANRSSDLQRHLLQVHIEGQTFTCKDCDKVFETNSDLLRHMGEAHDAVTFKCEQCPFVASDRGGLRQHVMTEHIKLNVSWYKCAQCAYRTVRKANLDRHIMYKHSINTILL